MKTVKQYRIVRDRYSGYEVQERELKKFLCWSYWTDWEESHLPGKSTNTHETIKEAKKFIKLLKKPVVWEEKNG